jgi:SAM-dependent methyltransferase
MRRNPAGSLGVTVEQQTSHRGAGVQPAYLCPLTGARLSLQGDQLVNSAGDQQYPIRAGIPQFLRFPSAEDTDTNAKLDRLNRVAREAGWRQGLEAVYGEDPDFISYVTDVARGRFIDLLPLQNRSDVLEIGPGLGQFTALLASRARSVCALEVVPGQAEFTAERCRQQGLTNVYVAAGGDDCRLPYGDQSFHLVVVNLVFEWCASRCPQERAVDVQRRMLNEIYRSLKPGGALYIATKNRFALRYIAGKRDEHCYGLRFGSALPRWLTHFLLKLQGHPRPFGTLYSHNALKKMLRNAGFKNIDSFWAAPEMRFPKQYVATDAASIRKARSNPQFIQGEMRTTRLLMPFIPARFVKYVTPGLAFLATKARNTSSKS